MNLPKPPKPPLPPPAPPKAYLTPLLNSIYSKNKKSPLNRASPPVFQTRIDSYFRQNFIDAYSENNNVICREINADNLLKNLRKTFLRTNLSSTTLSSIVVLPYGSNKSDVLDQHVVPTNPNNRVIMLNEPSLSKNRSMDMKSYRPIFTNSTFYLINIFLLSICLISIFLFILMIQLMTKRRNKKSKSTTNITSSSASSSSSSISFVACYSNSLNSSLHSAKTLHRADKNYRRSRLDKKLHGTISNPTNLKASLSNLKKKTFRTKLRHESQVHSPSRYNSIRDPYFQNNFQLRPKLNPGTLVFQQDSNEYDVINEIENNYRKIPTLDYQEYSRQFGHNFYNRDVDCTRKTRPDGCGESPSVNIYTIPVTKQTQNHFNDYCTIENFSKELENTYAYFNSDKTISSKMFPRTNPLCRNINYYVCKAVKPSDQELSENNQQENVEEEACFSKL